MGTGNSRVCSTASDERQSQSQSQSPEMYDDDDDDFMVSNDTDDAIDTDTTTDTTVDADEEEKSPNIFEAAVLAVTGPPRRSVEPEWSVESESETGSFHDRQAAMFEVQTSADTSVQVKLLMTNLREYKNPEASIVVCSYIPEADDSIDKASDDRIDAPEMTSFAAFADSAGLETDDGLPDNIIRVPTSCPVHLTNLRYEDSFPGVKQSYGKLWLMEFAKDQLVDTRTISAAYSLLAHHKRSLVSRKDDDTLTELVIPAIGLRTDDNLLIPARTIATQIASLAYSYAYPIHEQDAERSSKVFGTVDTITVLLPNSETFGALQKAFASMSTLAYIVQKPTDVAAATTRAPAPNIEADVKFLNEWQQSYGSRREVSTVYDVIEQVLSVYSQYEQDQWGDVQEVWDSCI
jgi:hypothetical protein